MVKILVCDDNFDILKVIKILLELKGYDVVTTSSGEECIEKALEINPDFIFLDVMMPEMDGWETLKEIRKYEKLKNIPISMLSAKDLTLQEYNKDKHDEMEQVVAYTIKPFRTDDLVETIDEYL